MTRRVQQAYGVILAGVQLLASALLVLLVVVVLAAVTVRYFGVFGGSLHWANELSRFSVIWAVMLGSVVAFDQGAHLAISLLPDSMSPRGKRAVNTLAQLLSALFIWVLCWQGFVITFATMGQVSPALGIPMGYVYLAVPVGAALMGLQSLLFAVFPDLKGSAKDDTAVT